MRRLDWHSAIAFTDVVRFVAIFPLDREALLARSHASEDGVILSGATAFAARWRAIPLLKPLRRVARNRMLLATLESLYLRFLQVRSQLQRTLRR